MLIFASSPRPSNLRSVILKHLMADARDCELSWQADFGKMELLLYVPIISPVLLLDFLMMLPKRDERFQQVGITAAVQISARFRIKLIVQSEEGDVCYELRVFRYQEDVKGDHRYGVELL